MSEPARKRGVLAGGEPSTSSDSSTSSEWTTDDDSSTIESSDSDDNNDDLVSSVLNVEFEGRNPQFSDFPGVKQLLQQLFLKAPVNLSDLSSRLITQPGIGSVIKQVHDDDDDDDDEDDNSIVDVNQVYGITTILNISQKTSECVENLHKLMLDLSNQFSDSDTTRFVNGLLSDDTKQVGLLINERYVNIPPPISVPLFHAIRKELFSLKPKDSSYNFDYLILISKIYKAKKDKKENKSFEGATVFWSNAEEEFFDDAADYKFEFCVQNDKGTGLAGNWVESDPEMVPFRRVLIFTMEKFLSVTNTLASFLEPAGTVYNSAYKPGSI